MKSTDLADEFGKRRADVLRDIRNIIKKEPELKKFCNESFYKSGKREYMMYIIYDKLLDRLRGLYSRPLKRDIEKEISDEIAIKVNGHREVPCEIGYIDVLTDKKLIEVKNYRQWKHAVGQLILYEKALKREYEKVLYLFGNCPNDYLDTITAYCNQINIEIHLCETI